jgi:hypothetical protein
MGRPAVTLDAYRAADGWTIEDSIVIHLLTGSLPDARALIHARARLLNWIDEAPTKEPAR